MNHFDAEMNLRQPVALGMEVSDHLRAGYVQGFWGRTSSADRFRIFVHATNWFHQLLERSPLRRATGTAQKQLSN